MKGYLANNLFDEANIMYNDYLAKLIRERFSGIDLFVPQEQDINDKSSYADSIMISRLDKDALLDSDFLVAVIDGVEIDAGVATEIGVYEQTGKPIIALYTDIRQQGRDNQKKIDALIEDGTENQFMYKNLFTIGIIKDNGVVVSNTDEMLDSIDNLVYKKES